MNPDQDRVMLFVLFHMVYGVKLGFGEGSLPRYAALARIMPSCTD